jgi:rod shape-determining protein MreD
VSTAIGLLLVIVASLAQVSVLPQFSVFGVQPNVVIVLLVAWIAVRGQREALLLIPAAGFLLGLLDSEPLGLAMLALAPLILLTELRELELVASHLLPAFVLVVIATLVYEGAILLTLAVTGDHTGLPGSVLDVLVPAAIVNVLLLIPVYGAVRLASVDLQRQPSF